MLLLALMLLFVLVFLGVGVGVVVVVGVVGGVIQLLLLVFFTISFFCEVNISSFINSLLEAWNF